MGSIMWYILFLKIGRMMLITNKQITFKSLSNCRRGYSGSIWQMARMIEGCPYLPIWVQYRIIEEILKTKPTPNTISNSFFMEYDLCTRV